MKSVAIIGAGPAGLVAAKTLLHSHPEGTFQVSVYEQSSRSGGLWAVEPSTKDGLINPEMRTNLSRFTVSFSDLSWDSIETGVQKDDNHLNTSTAEATPTPIYPKAWQVDRYLQHYAKKFIPINLISFDTRIKRAERIQLNGHVHWKLISVNLQSKCFEEAESIFDHVIVASGYLAQPRQIGCELQGFTPSKCLAQILHNSQFRKLSDLSASNKRLGRGTILVVGGSHSGGDIAASIAFQMSSGKYSPSIESTEPLEIVHVVPHPMHAIPPFIPSGNDTRGFMPLDFLLYATASRPPGPISFSFEKMIPERAKGTQTLIQSLVDGGDTDSSSQATKTQEAEELNPPYAIVNESYVEFVRSGAIVPKLGRLLSLSRQQSDNSLKENSTDLRRSTLLSASIATDAGVDRVKDVAAVVYATGYEASTALGFLPNDVKKDIGFDDACPRIPMLLEGSFLTSTAAVPDLAFIGFSDGPYWGVMEMQARITAKRWADPESNFFFKSQDPTAFRSSMRGFRQAINSEKSTVPQNLFSDYVGIMEQASRELDLERNDLGWGKREGPICPARYLNVNGDPSEARKTMTNLQQTWEKARHKGAFVPRVVFRALHEFDFEYLYIEKYTPPATTTRQTEKQDRRMIYRYTEASDKISVWSVNGDDNLSAGILDHTLTFNPASSQADEKNIWTATGTCVHNGAPTKSMTYNFSFSGTAIRKFSVFVTTSGEGGGANGNGNGNAAVDLTTEYIR